MVEVIAIGSIIAIKFQVVIEIPFEFVKLILIILSSDLDAAMWLIRLYIEYAEMVDELTNKFWLNFLKKRDFRLR